MTTVAPVPSEWQVVPPDGEDYPAVVIEVRKPMGQVLGSLMVETRFLTVDDLREIHAAVMRGGGR